LASKLNVCAPAVNGDTLKPSHVEHWPQFESWEYETRVWPSLVRSIPKKETCVYQMTKTPTVAIPT
jgi:hypothetical protein